MKEIINVTDIVAYLYCPRKVYLKRVKKIKEPPTKPMILGFLKHKIFDIFNKNEAVIVSSIKENIEKEKITATFKIHLVKIIHEVMSQYERMVKGFKIESKEILDSVSDFMDKEISLRADSIKKALDVGFREKELWRNLKPKYLTEFQIVSSILGLKGRVDRIKFEGEICPYEIKTRPEVYESDKIQLAAYSLLLEEEFGRTVNKGVVEAAKTREEIEIDGKMKAKVLELAERIRTLRQEPEFQENFKKCKSCRLRKQCFDL